jgi:hypothetical protein
MNGTTANIAMFRAGFDEFSVDAQMGRRQPCHKETHTGWHPDLSALDVRCAR